MLHLGSFSFSARIIAGNAASVVGTMPINATTMAVFASIFSAFGLLMLVSFTKELVVPRGPKGACTLSVC